LIVISVFLWGGVIEQKSDLNKTMEKLKTEIVEIDRKLDKYDFYIKYSQYQKLKLLKNRVSELKRKIYYLKRRKKTKKIKEKLENALLQKIAYEKQLEIISGGKDNLFDSIIDIKPLPPTFNLTNPFEIVSALNYIKHIKLILKKYK